MLVIETKCRVVPVTLRRQPELPALIGGVACGTQAVVGAIKTAGCQAPVSDRCATPGIDTAIIAVAALDAQAQFGVIRGFARNEVDQPAQGIGGEDGGGAAAHHLDRLEGVVDTEGLVGIEIAKAGIVLDWQSVLQHRQRGETITRDAAGADIV